MRLTGVDRTTAFFATVPGGVIETTTLAPLYGGQLEPIMVAQTTRVALIVVFAPFLVISFAGSGAQNPLLAVPVRPMVAGARAASRCQESSRRCCRARARPMPG